MKRLACLKLVAAVLVAPARTTAAVPEKLVGVWANGGSNRPTFKRTDRVIFRLGYYNVPITVKVKGGRISFGSIESCWRGSTRGSSSVGCSR